MSKLQAIQIDDNTVIYLEATEETLAPATTANGQDSGEVQRSGAKGWGGRPADMPIAQSFQAIETTIKTYTKYTLNAFKDAALAEVQKVTLEFGVNVSGMGGVPYIAAGTVGCNIKVTVECAFPERRLPQVPPQRPPQAVPQRPPQAGVPQRLPQ